MAYEQLAVHTQYTASRKNPKKDLTITKMRIENEGVVSTELVLNLNVKRPFYVAKGSSKREVKVEWMPVNRLNKFMVRQSKLLTSVKSVMRDDPIVRQGRGLRACGGSPNLYWTDLHVTSYVLDKYRQKFNSRAILPVVGVMDFEWDIATKSPSIGTYVHNNQVFVTIREDKLRASGYSSNEKFIADLKAGHEKHIKPMIKAYYAKEGVSQVIRDFTVHCEVVKNELDVIRTLFGHTHTTQPDYLAFWNGISDLTVIKDTCDRWSINMSTFMCDPAIPSEFRNTFIKEGQTERLDAKGNSKRVAPQEQWHVLENMASWEFIDLMGVYAANRAHLPDLASYAQDFVLNLELDMGKLRLVEDVKSDDIVAWHNEMSGKHILEYTLYAMGDVINPLILEDKNFEISAQAFPNLGRSPISDFKKNPRKLTTEAHFSFLESGSAVSATPPSMETPLDNEIYGADGWIITLNTSYNVNQGGYALSDSYNKVDIVPNAADSDLTSSYPTNSILGNMARYTTATEVVSISRTDRDVGKIAGLSLMAGRQNLTSFAIDVFNLPTLDKLLTGEY